MQQLKKTAEKSTRAFLDIRYHTKVATTGKLIIWTGMVFGSTVPLTRNLPPLVSRETRRVSRENETRLVRNETRLERNENHWTVGCAIYYSREASVHWQIDATAGTEKCDRLKIFIDSRKTGVYFFWIKILLPNWRDRRYRKVRSTQLRNLSTRDKPRYICLNPYFFDKSMRTKI